MTLDPMRVNWRSLQSVETYSNRMARFTRAEMLVVRHQGSLLFNVVPARREPHIPKTSIILHRSAP